jgi:hypothetical protein
MFYKYYEGYGISREISVENKFGCEVEGKIFYTILRRYSPANAQVFNSSVSLLFSQIFSYLLSNLF